MCMIPRGGEEEAFKQDRSELFFTQIGLMEEMFFHWNGRILRKYISFSNAFPGIT